ncbi:hypothetical protein CA54_54710 [Symmachiella macrocystis]|uniref:DUF4190 domain-containing protein n=1 Tax=Symmachiella macrocystis TaxID=2527985 RepID=A0A5C6B6Z7_9PLAN|nr:DUF4190 domain-containing protein [Symmachiella macrocystis]TWU07066.1 hypothetical protein CA54_54710 [Symmachiella macrocystis]
MSETQKPEGAGTILVLGILGLVLCAPLGTLAWLQGNSYLEKCRAAGVEPEGSAVGGRICGIIATVFLIIGILGGVLMMVLGIGAGIANS